MNWHISPAKVQFLQCLTKVLGGNHDKKGRQVVHLFKLDARGSTKPRKDAALIAKARSPQQGTQHPTFLNPLIYQKVGDLDNNTLGQLCNDVSILLSMLIFC